MTLTSVPKKSTQHTLGDQPRRDDKRKRLFTRNTHVKKIKSLLNNKNVDSSKLRAFADDNLNLAQLIQGG